VRRRSREDLTDCGSHVQAYAANATDNWIKSIRIDYRKVGRRISTCSITMCEDASLVKSSFTNLKTKIHSAPEE